MTIGVSSQNRRTVTSHAGRCRRFWVYEVVDGRIASRHLLDLAKGQSLHATAPEVTPALGQLEVLLVGGMGPGLSQRLAARGIHVYVSTETDPAAAVIAFLATGTRPA